jgi:Ca2+-binding RTX toxin-like protein
MSGSSISGNIFLDQNADGSIGSGDTFLSGVTVTLLVLQPTTGLYIPTADTTTTAANGSYTFTGLAAGTYRVDVIAPTGTTFSPAGSSSTLTNATIGTNGLSTSPIVLGSNTIVTNQDAGVYKAASFSGTVFVDNNNDGLEDNADTGLAGVTVQLLNGSGSVVSTTTTSTNGTYTFSNLVPGTYSAHVVAPSGSSYSVLGSDATPQPTGGTATPASPNLITNGQFSTVGTSTFFSGWTESANTVATPWGSGTGGGPELYNYTTNLAEYGTPSSFSTDPFAGSPTADNVNPYYTTPSTDAAFFVDDDAIETLSQSINVVAGTTYEVGFDLNETLPGLANAGFFSLTASINGVAIVTAGSTAGTILTPGTWTHFADLYTATTTGSVTLSFTYEAGVPGSNLFSKDVLVDDVYVVAGQYTTNLTPTSEVNPTTGTTTPVTLSSGQSVGNESAGIVFQPATITGTVFADSNDDGAKESTEAGVPGVTVNLSSSTGAIIATTTTNAAGTYTFANQAAGTYTVQVVSPSGDTFSTVGTSSTLLDSTVSSTGAQTVTVAHGATATVNAGVFGPGTVSGVVFTDINGDGSENGSDTGLSGQTVKLLASNGTTVVATTTTNSLGAYSFTGVAPGSYTVSVTKATGDTFSTAGTANVTTTSGSAITAPSVGEYAPSTISGTVFTDTNADGTQETGETGFAGQTVQLLQGTTVVATTTTAANGGYSFSGVAPGSYTVSVTKATGDTFSTASTASVTTTSGSAITAPSVGEYAPSTITGTVFNDTNADGTQETGEGGFAGQTVQLLQGTTVVATTTTAANGGYSFSGVAPGNYTVSVTKATGDTFSTASTANVTTTSGSAITAPSVGEYAPSTITGTVFNDENGNGVQNAGDPGFASQTVQLLQGTTVVATTTTGTSGTYSFSGVAPGSYTVSVSHLAGDTFSPVGTSTTLPDSIVSAAGKASVTATSGSTTVVNAGEESLGTGSISSVVFFDGLSDGTYHVGDPGVEGVTVELLSGSKIVATTTTNSSGVYSFNGIAAGSYTVKVIAPAGTSFSTTEHASGNPLLDSDVNPTTGVSDPVTVVAQQTTTDVSAGLIFNGNFAGNTPTTIGSGQAYSGNSSSGVIVGSGNDNVHTGSGGNNVVILGGGNNIIEEGSGATNDIGVASGALNAQTQDAANGFLFAGTGNSVLQGEQGNAYLVGGTGQNTVAGGSANNVLVGGISGGSVTASGTKVTSYTTGSEVRITGTSATILYQKGDGVQVLDNTFNPAIDKLEIFGYTSGTIETLPNGQTALYLGGNDLIVFNGGNPFTAGTGSNFAGVTFTANIAAAPQYVVTFGANGLPEIVPSGGATTAAPQTGTVSGTVFNDANLDGKQEATEAGIAGQTVRLLEGTAVIATTTTASDGSYSFSGVSAGNYTVSVTQAAGDTFTTAGTANVTVTASANSVAASIGEHAATAATTTPAPTTATTPTSITMSAFNESLTLDGKNYTVSGSQGNATITAGNGNDTINAGGYNNTITLGSGSDSVTGPQGNTVVTAGGGNNNINVSGFNDTITLGNGNNTITGPQGSTAVTVGSGNNTIALQGSGNTITTVSGNNTIAAGAGNDTVNTESANDVVTLSGWGNLITGGSGADSFIGGSGNTYQVSSASSTGNMEVKDFSLNNGDVLDLSKVLTQAGWNQAATTLAGFLKVSEVGTNTVIGVDPTGSGGNFHTVATLDGLGVSSLSMLQSRNSINL